MPTVSMLSKPYITLIMLWIIYAVVHSGMASGIVTRLMMKLLGRFGKYYRVIYSLLVLVTLCVLIHYHFSAIDTIMFRPYWIEKIIAAILVLSGLAVMIVCLWRYLLPQSGLHAIFGIEENLPLQETGLHAYMRHPMFTGSVVFIWGVFLGYPYMNNLVSAICLTIYSFIAIGLEESRLIAIHGDLYRQYRKRVPIFPSFRKTHV